MWIRSNALHLTVLLLTVIAPFTLADDFTCEKEFTIGDKKYDFTKFRELKTVEHYLYDTDQIKNINIVVHSLLNVCDDISEEPKEVTEETICKGARVCVLLYFSKQGKDGKNTTMLIDSIAYGKGKPQAIVSQAGDLILMFENAKYVATLNMHCDQNADEKTIFYPDTPPSERGLPDKFSFKWNHPKACDLNAKPSPSPTPTDPNKPAPTTPPSSDDEDDDDDKGSGKKKRHKMSPAGIVFLVYVIMVHDLRSRGRRVVCFLFVLFATYMILGAAFNYTIRRERGVDIIPHRRFWSGLFLGFVECIGSVIGWIVEKVTGRPRGYHGIAI